MELQRLDLLIKEGIDVLVHMGWYEGTDFWTPKNFRRLLRRASSRSLTRLMRTAYIPIIITQGWKP